MDKSVSILIPNFNGAVLLKENLPSIFRAIQYYNRNNGNFKELLITDDCSDDNSIEILKIFQKKYKFLNIRRNSFNAGFGENSNIGFKNLSSDIVLLLNSDVKVPENFIETIIAPFEDISTFAVSPVIQDNNKGILSGSYKVPYLKRGEIKYRKWKHINFENKNFLLTFFCEGGSVAIDRRKFLEVGGFDSIYKPFYYEDNDLCIKAWKRGWKCLFMPNIKVLHEHKSTISKHYNAKYIKTVMRRNRFIFLWSNLPFVYLIFIHIPNIFLRILSYSVRFDFCYSSGLIKALKYIGKIKIKREREGTNTFFKIVEQIQNDFKNVLFSNFPNSKDLSE